MAWTSAISRRRAAWRAAASEISQVSSPSPNSATHRTTTSPPEIMRTPPSVKSTFSRWPSSKSIAALFSSSATSTVPWYSSPQSNVTATRLPDGGGLVASAVTASGRVLAPTARNSNGARPASSSLPSLAAARTSAPGGTSRTRPIRGEDLASGPPWTESFDATPRVSHNGQSQPSGTTSSAVSPTQRRCTKPWQRLPAHFT